MKFPSPSLHGKHRKAIPVLCNNSQGKLQLPQLRKKVATPGHAL